MQLPRANETWYLIVFGILSVSGATLVLVAELGFRTSDGWVSTLANIGHGLQWVVVVSGVVSYTTMEGLNMLYERYARRKLQEGREEGLAEGRKEGRVEGLAEGREEVVRHLASVVHSESLSPEERLAEVDRVIKEMQRPRA